MSRPVYANERTEKVYDERYCLPRARKYPRLWAWLLRWLQRKCQHYALKADILESCSRDYSVRWCETCGAISIVGDCSGTPLRLCEPTWEPSGRPAQTEGGG